MTVKNMEVLRVDEENNLLLVHGAVPGARGAYLMVHRRPRPAGESAKAGAVGKKE